MIWPGTIPEFCGVAFKEWAGVCDALADGRQSLILRKGGIAEGPGGFAPEHLAFWLFPTHLHEAQQGLRSGLTRPVAGPTGRVELRCLAVVEVVGFVDRPEVLADLDDLHVWTAETIGRRFHYRRPGLWALGVRAYRRPTAVAIAETAAMAGCKSWVELEHALPTAGLTPVLDEAESRRRMDRLRERLGSAVVTASSRGDAE